MSWPLAKNRREPHAAPDVERASGELLGRLEVLTTALERLVEEREHTLTEREQHGDR